MKNLYALLSHLKNGLERHKLIISVPYSKVNMKVLELLFQEGYLIGYFRDTLQPKTIIVKLRFTIYNYLKDLKAYRINSNQRHLTYEEMKFIGSRVRFGVVTTTSGIMSIQQATRLKLGGQVFFTF
jgi:ribosomal protein S8